ncbi:hypothetical protein HQ590_15270, partial [bacterium]|nr:hypothetical protein [bacterium]
MICWLGCQTRSLGHFLALDKMTYEPRAARVIDHSRMNLTTHRNFEVFSAADFLAAVTQHPPSLKLRRTGIPDGWLARR